MGVLKLSKENGGAFYNGHFEEGLMHGEGFYKSEDAAEYLGIFVKGVQHGKGVLTMPDKTQIIGQWEGGKMIEGDYNFTVGDT